MGTRCEKQAIDIAWNIVDFTEYENDSENAERQLPRLGSGVRIASPAPFSSQNSMDCMGSELGLISVLGLGDHRVTTDLRLKEGKVFP